MADQIELLKEANRRGILPESKRALFDEAVKRGLITIDTPDQSQMMPSHGQPEPVADWKQTAATYGRPVLEAAGLTAGSLIGAAAGGLPAVAGGALGYGAGRQAANLLENFLIDKPAQTPMAALKGAGEDLVTGAAMEMGGQAIGAALPHVAQFVKRTGSAVVPSFGKKAAEKQAADIWQAAQSAPQSAELSATEARNAAQTAELMKRKGITDIQPTPAQQTGSYKAGYLEQGRSAADPEFAAQLAERDSTLAGKARGDLVNTLKPNAPISARTAQETGEGIVSKVKAAETPVREAESEAWDAVNTAYTIETPATRGAFSEIGQDVVPPDIKSIVGKVESFYKEAPKTVKGLRKVESYLTQLISTASKAGERETVHHLSKIKTGIKNDFDSLSEAANTGNLFEYQGKLVDPATLTKELETAILRVDEISNAAAVPDVPAMVNAIRAKGFPFMRNVNETAESYGARMAKDYEHYFGTKPPTIADPKVQASLQANKDKIDSINEIIAKMQPADDVAKQIKAAKAATIERAERFRTGTTKDVLARGDELSGLRVPYESVPSRYFSQTGADDLIRAVGKKDAAQLMTEHVKRSLEGLSKDGVLNIPAAMKFMQKNTPTMKRLGIDADARQIIKEQIPAAIRARLDQRLVTDRFGKDTNTLTEVRGIIRDFGPAMRQLYGGGSKEITALLDYHKMLQVLGRNKNVNYASGSNTVDKLMGALQSSPQGSLMRKLVDNLAEVISGTGAGFAVGGPAGAAIGGLTGAAARTSRKVISEHQRAAVEKLLQEAITNPETASLLMRIGKGYKPKPIEMKRALNGWEMAAKIVAPQVVNGDE